MIAFGTLEGAFFKHAKRVEQLKSSDWAPPPGERLERPTDARG